MSCRPHVPQDTGRYVSPDLIEPPIVKTVHCSVKNGSDEKFLYSFGYHGKKVFTGNALSAVPVQNIRLGPNDRARVMPRCVC